MFSKTTVAGRRYPPRSSLPVLGLDLPELGVVEGLGVPEAEAVGRVVHVERPHVEDAEVLVLVAIIETVRVPHPLQGKESFRFSRAVLSRAKWLQSICCCKVALEM